LKLVPSPRHWRGRTDAELWPPEMAAQYRANDRKVLATGKVLQTVEPYPRRGLSGCMLVSKFPIRDGSGAVTMVGGVGIDVTERQEAEAALRDSEQHLRLFMEATADCLWNWDLETGNVVRSSGFNRAFGYSAREMDSTIAWWEERLHSGDRGKVLSAFQETIARGRNACSYEYRFRRKNGTYALIHDRAYIVRDTRGKPVRALGAMTDITERKLAEAQLERSKDQLRALAFRLQKAREDESRRIAREIHDVFGQALATLNLDVVWLGQTIAQEQDRALRSQLRKRLKSMEVLLHSTVNSIQRFCQDLRPAMLDDLGLAATLQWQAADFEKRTRIRCQWKPKPEAVILNGNEATALFRIFQETLHNVARHARARLVTLKLQKISGHLVLKVADDGAGFDESKLPVRRSLGLLGMRERAILIGADLQVQSAPGKGTTVTVTMPITSAILKKIRKHDPRGHAA